MSTTSEYYIRNMSMSEFERFNQRLQKQERQRTRAELKAQLDKELARARKEDGKLREAQRKALQKQLDKLAKESKEQAKCNQRMLGDLGERLEQMKAEGDAQYVIVEQTIDALKLEQKSLSGELDGLRSSAEELTRALDRLDQELSHEKAEREAAQERASGYYQGLNGLYQRRFSALPHEAFSRFQLDASARAIELGVTQAKEQFQSGIESAAASTIAQSLRDAEALTQQLNNLEDEERSLTLETRLHAEGSRSKLKELNREEIRRYLGAQVDRLAQRLGQLSAQQESFQEVKSWPERRALLLQLRADLEVVDQEVTALYQRYDELIEQSAHRENILRGLVQALVEVWGGEYEMDAYLEDPNDLTSALLFRTKRGPYAPNVQARIGIDGRMEANLTGYHGVECAQDEEQLREALSRRSKVEVVRHQHEVKPDAPNPDEVGRVAPGPSVAISEPAKASARPRWTRRSV